MKAVMADIDVAFEIVVARQDCPVGLAQVVGFAVVEVAAPNPLLIPRRSARTILWLFYPTVKYFPRSKMHC